MNEAELRARQARRRQRVLQAESERMDVLQEGLGQETAGGDRGSPHAAPSAADSRVAPRGSWTLAPILEGALRWRLPVAVSLGVACGLNLYSVELSGLRIFLYLEAFWCFVAALRACDLLLSSLVVVAAFALFLPWSALLGSLPLWVVYYVRHRGGMFALAQGGFGLASNVYGAYSAVWSDFCIMFSVYQLVRFVRNLA